MNKIELKRRISVFTLILVIFISIYTFDYFNNTDYFKFAGWINLIGLIILYLYEVYLAKNKEKNLWKNQMLKKH